MSVMIRMTVQREFYVRWEKVRLASLGLARRKLGNGDPRGEKHHFVCLLGTFSSPMKQTRYKLALSHSTVVGMPANRD